MATALVTHPLFFAHEVPGGHPESSRRLAAIDAQLHANGITNQLQQIEAPRAMRAQIERVHTPQLIDKLQKLSPASGLAAIDADTFMGAHTLEAAWHAAGAAVLATTSVIEGRADHAFCAVRPPGHHAERDRAMGFCFFNNVAVAAAHALYEHGLQRVAILDFDVHHGNGTEDIFANDNRVLLCSTFQHPFYPFSGANSSSDHIINVPLPAGANGNAYRTAITKQWLPVIDEFDPQMIFVSAGFDGHIEDQMAQHQLEDDDYLWIAQAIRNVADRYADGKIVTCLEGGYATGALGRCVSLYIRVLENL